MPVSKQQSIKLSQTRVTHKENLKKQRVDQEIVENNHNISNDKASSGRYWHDNSNKDYFNLNKKLAGETQDKQEKETLIGSGSQLFVVKQTVLEWDAEAKIKLCGI